ncbi:MAG: hypothetical protein KGZ43_03550, partial [Sulfuritalea sp.]|nr:hypothetical protein [Sulfuritalea sp.]
PGATPSTFDSFTISQLLFQTRFNPKFVSRKIGGGSAVAAGKPQAGEQPYRWPAQWRSGGGAGGTAVSEGTKAVARFYRVTAWWSPRRGSDGAGLAGLLQAP